ncbi:MAG: hypothetical protein DVB23_000907 [Verrucomicrobia bacterium]|nr:MAG: hypothetical protein DVB23_000907 [Verrucomicrobiota bacterium]
MDLVSLEWSKQEILTGEEGSKAELSDLARMPQPMPPAPADNHIPSPG